MAQVYDEPIVVRLTQPVGPYPVGAEFGFDDLAQAIRALGSSSYFTVVRTQDGDPIPPPTPEDMTEAERQALARARAARLIRGKDFDPLVPGPGEVIVGGADGPLAVPQTAPPGLIFPEHLDRWRMGLGRALDEPRVITVIGDSITDGFIVPLPQGASGAVREGVHEQRGYVGHLRRHFAKVYGDTGTGGMMPTDDRTTRSVAPILGDYAPAERSVYVINTSAFTFNVPACTTIVIHAYCESPTTSAPFTYKIDDGEVQTATLPATANTWYRVTVNGLSDTPHTLTLSGTDASKRAYIGMVQALRNPDRGVRVHRFGVHANTSEMVMGAVGTASRTHHKRAAFDETGAHLGIFFFGANEMRNYQETQPPDVMATSLADLATYMTETRGGSALLVAGFQFPVMTGSEQYSANDYYDALYEVAAGNPNCAVFDVRHIFGWTKEDQAAKGIWEDQVHPNATGHAALGRALYEALI